MLLVCKFWGEQSQSLSAALLWKSPGGNARSKDGSCESCLPSKACRLPDFLVSTKHEKWNMDTIIWKGKKGKDEGDYALWLTAWGKAIVLVYGHGTGTDWKDIESIHQSLNGP